MSERDRAMLDRVEMLLRDLRPDSRWAEDRAYWQRFSDYWLTNADFEPTSEAGQGRRRVMKTLGYQLVYLVEQPDMRAAIDSEAGKRAQTMAITVRQYLQMTELQIHDRLKVERAAAALLPPTVGQVAQTEQMALFG